MSDEPGTTGDPAGDAAAGEAAVPVEPPAAEPSAVEAPAGAAAPERVSVPEVVESSLPADAPRIHLPEFDGPLDLLLYLIRREKIDIHDMPIAPITSTNDNAVLDSS